MVVQRLCCVQYMPEYIYAGSLCDAIYLYGTYVEILYSIPNSKKKVAKASREYNNKQK